MKTFKQFLSENDPLNDLAVEMWLRHHLKLSNAEAVEVRKWLEGEGDILLSDELYRRFIGNTSGFIEGSFRHLIPFSVLRFEADDTPETWLLNYLTDRLKEDGIEIE